MVDGISTKAAVGTIKVARLKVGGASTPAPNISFNNNETQLSELAKINPAIKERVEKGRKLDAFLRLANQIMGFLNGTTSQKVSAPQFSKIDIEYVEMKNPYQKTDKTV